MILTEQHIITKYNLQWKLIDNLCFLSKNLYNSAIYEIKQEFIKSAKVLRYVTLEKILKNKEEFNDYYKLPPAVSQSILIVLNRNIKSYFILLRKWKKDKRTFRGCPKFPKYKHKTEGRNLIIFNKNTIRFKEGLIYFPKKISLNPLGTKIKSSNFKQIRIVPKSGCYVIEVIYEKQEKEYKETKNKAAIDLGINNLAVLTINKDYRPPKLINGRPLKSTNQYYNKRKTNIQSKLELRHKVKTSNKLLNLTLKRNNKIKDYLHKASRIIVNYLVEQKISELVIGHNKEWKQKSNIGKINNQNFNQIPFNTFINMIKYKSKLEGIKVKEISEEYTSKCSALDLEELIQKEIYSGKRIKRGLFKTEKGLLINADVNGSLNIGRKAFGDEFIPANRGFVVNPDNIFKSYQN